MSRPSQPPPSGSTSEFINSSSLPCASEAPWLLATAKPPFPEMVYTTSLRRLSTAPFVNHVMPLMVTYVLTFAILLFMVKDDERSFNILSALTGLFFLTLLNHQQINTVASAVGDSFLGLASGMMYVSFFGVAENGLAVARMKIPML